MKKRKWLLIVSLSLNIISICYFGYQMYEFYLEHLRITRTYSGMYFYMGRDKLFEVLPKDSSEIVFIGDSHIQHVELAELFRNNRIKNRGISGDITAGVLYRFTDVLKSKPSKLFIEAGTNDITRGYTEDTIMYNFDYMFRYAQYLSPNTKLYALSIFPNACELKDREEKSIIITDRLNKRLQALCQKYKVTYIDFSSDLEKNGHIVPKYYIADSLHLSAEGYLLFKHKLEPYVNE